MKYNAAIEYIKRLSDVNSARNLATLYKNKFLASERRFAALKAENNETEIYLSKLTAQVEELKLAVAASNKALKLAKVGLSYSDDCFAGEYAAKCKKMIEITDELLTRIGEDNE